MLWQGGSAAARMLRYYAARSPATQAAAAAWAEAQRAKAAAGRGDDAVALDLYKRGHAHYEAGQYAAALPLIRGAAVRDTSTALSRGRQAHCWMWSRSARERLTFPRCSARHCPAPPPPRPVAQSPGHFRLTDPLAPPRGGVA